MRRNRRLAIAKNENSNLNEPMHENLGDMSKIKLRFQEVRRSRLTFPHKVTSPEPKSSWRQLYHYI